MKASFCSNIGKESGHNFVHNDYLNEILYVENSVNFLELVQRNLRREMMLKRNISLFAMGSVLCIV